MHQKDKKTKKLKRYMFFTVMTDIPGLERIDAASEVPDDSPLGKEVDLIVTHLVDLKKKEIRKNNKKKLNDKKNKKLNSGLLKKKSRSSKKESGV